MGRIWRQGTGFISDRADGGKLDYWGDCGDMEDNREAVRIIIGKERTAGEDPGHKNATNEIK